MAGNANSGRRQEKPFRDALRMEIAAVADGDPKSLRNIARKLLEKAGEGDMQAIKELADRTDGKVAQAIVGDDEHDPLRLVSRIELVALSSGPDSKG